MCGERLSAYERADSGQPRMRCALFDAIISCSRFWLLVATPAEALECTVAHQPAVSLVPSRAGLDLSWQLRRLRTAARIPIILLSYYSELGCRVPQLSVDDFLAKPFELDDLYAALARWLPADGEPRLSVRIACDFQPGFSRNGNRRSTNS